MKIAPDRRIGQKEIRQNRTKLKEKCDENVRQMKLMKTETKKDENADCTMTCQLMRKQKGEKNVKNNKLIICSNI